MTDYFVINEIIKDEDRDIYYYGLRQGFLILINSMTIIVAPVEDANKPLDRLEKKIYKKRTRVILALESVIITLAILLNFNKVALIISIAVLALSFMLILGEEKVNNKKDKNKQL